MFVEVVRVRKACRQTCVACRCDLSIAGTGGVLREAVSGVGNIVHHVTTTSHLRTLPCYYTFGVAGKERDER